MPAIYAEFEQQLVALQKRYRGDMRKEMIHLFLLALEREEIVSVAYRESAIAQRLQTMPIGDDIRRLVAHALVWAWKDEEMHAVYIRGAILRLGNIRLKLQAYLTQIGGAIGGWASSIQQHVPWRRGPLSRSIAGFITLSGSLAGKVPADVRQSLRYGPFRDFCTFNVEAERTAWLCWNRLASLASLDRSVPVSLAADFKRIEADEELHRQMFDILASAFDHEDRLVVSSEELIRQLSTLGESFVPRDLRDQARKTNPLGSGGRVVVRKGSPSDDKRTLLRTVLDGSGLRDEVEAALLRSGKPIEELRVAVKPTFMLGYDRRDLSHVTDPALVEELALWLRGLGCREIAVVEAPNIYDRFYTRRTVPAVAEYLGYNSDSYRLVDLGAEQVPHQYRRGMAQYTVGATWKEADLRVSFAKLRSHPIELAHLSVANLEWTGARCDEFLFSERQAQRQTAVMMIMDAFPPHFALIDAYDSAADGLVGVMGCSRPPAPRRIYGGRDALAVDIVALRHLGVSDPRDSSLLKASFHWFGCSESAIEVIGCDDRIDDWRGPYESELSSLLSLLANPVYILGSGRGTLFVPEMDKRAFPPIEPEGAILKAGRWFTRRVLRLHLR